MSLFLTALERLKDEDNEEGKKKEEEEEEVDDAIVVGVSDAVLDTVKRLKYKARAPNFLYFWSCRLKSMNGQTECRNKKSSRTEHKKIAKRKTLHIKPSVSANNGEENEESRYVTHIEE